MQTLFENNHSLIQQKKQQQHPSTMLSSPQPQPQPQPLPLPPVQTTLAKPQRPKSKSLQPCRCPKEGCGKIFSKRSNLKAHMRVHSGVLPYPCQFPGCTKRFRWKSSLKPHVKVHLASAHTLNSTHSSSTNLSSATTAQPPPTPEQHHLNSLSPNNSIPKQIFPKSPLKIPTHILTQFTPTHPDSSPTSVMDSSFFEPSAAPQLQSQSSRLHHCTFPACGESYPRLSHLLEHEIAAGHQGNRPQVARVLFQDSNDKEIDLTCASVLSESQASYETDVVSFTLDSQTEDASSAIDAAVPIAEDLWKNDLSVMDPLLDLSPSFGAAQKVIDMLSPEECGSAVSAMNTQENISLTEQQWFLPSTEDTTSTADFTASLYI